MKPILRAITLLLASLIAVGANAAQYNFSYTFASGGLVSGSLTGTQNGLFVENVSNVSVAFNGNTFVGNTDFYQPYSFTAGCCFVAGAAVISFDGNLNNFSFSDGAPNTPAVNYFNMNGTDKDFWWTGDLSPLRTASVWFGNSYVSDVTANSPSYPGANGGFDASRWSLTLASEVPEPETFALLLAGLGLLAGTTRRRQR
jgi:hypothetical protein